MIGTETDCDSKDMSIDLSSGSIFSLNDLENKKNENSDLDKYIAEYLSDTLNIETQENAQEIVIDGNRASTNTYKNEANNCDKDEFNLTLLHNSNFDNYSKSSYNNIDLNLTHTKYIDIKFEKCAENNLHVNTELKQEKKETSQNEIQSDFDISGKLTDVNKNLEVISPCFDVNQDFDISLCSSKRSRSDSENSFVVNKKYKGNIKRVSIVPENDDSKVTIHLTKKLQTLISTAIDDASFLPLLQCHGIKNNYLVYSCHNEKTYLWLKEIIDVASDLKVKIVDVEFEDENCYKLKLKINSFIEENFNKLLSRIELYNAGLVTDKWKLINRQIFRDFIIMTLWVDKESYQYICDSTFSLFAGIDKIQFSVCF